MRISTLVSPGLVARRLEQCFGEDPLSTEDARNKLVVEMKLQLASNMEQEHTSPLGLALLWQATYGSFTPAMRTVVEKYDKHLAQHEELLREAETVFMDYVKEEDDTAASTLEFDRFYEAYLRPYVGCFTCPRTRFVLDAIDCDDDGNVQWAEWRSWCIWALHEYPDEIDNGRRRSPQCGLAPSHYPTQSRTSEL